MSALVYGGLDLDDGVTYFPLDPIDVGERTKTWSEYRGLGGTVAQYNVSEASLIEMHLPLEVRGNSAATLAAAVAAINTVIDAGPASLVFDDGSGAVTFNCVYGPRVRYLRDVRSQVGFWTTIDLVLYRTPDVSSAPGVDDLGLSM